MKIPETIRVGNRIFEVKYPYIFTDSCQPLNGQCDTELQTIRISQITQHGEKRHDRNILHTLIHEIIHAVDFVYCGYKIQKVEEAEDLIDQLAEGIVQVLQDNDIDLLKT